MMGGQNVAILAALVLSTSACTGGSADAGADAGTVTSDENRADAAPDPVAGESIRVGGFIGEFTAGFPAYEGAVVSIVDHPEIAPVVTDADGLYVFPRVPANIEIIVRAELGDFHPAASRIIELAEADYEVAPMFMFHPEFSGYLAAYAGHELDQTRGFIGGGVWRDTDEVLEGAVVTLDPPAAEVVYSNGGGIPDPTLTGVSPGATFVLWNVPIGDYELSASHPTTTRCYAGGPEEQEPIRVRTFPNTMTFALGFICGQ